MIGPGPHVAYMLVTLHFSSNTHILFKARNVWLSWQPESYSLLIQVNFDSIEESKLSQKWGGHSLVTLWYKLFVLCTLALANTLV